MSNTIKAELELAKTKMFEEVKFNDRILVKLTRDNVAIAEAMMRNDSAYLRSMEKGAAPVGKKYGGSSAYWMTQLKKYLIDHRVDGKYSYVDIIKGAVESVDRENSTHLNADKCGRQEIIKRLYEFNKERLLECLKNPDDMDLFNEISKITSASKGARKNVSFASKFCHYACFYIYEDTEYQDNYSIYDSILKKVLPMYLEYYKVNHYRKRDLEDYCKYRKAVDEIRKASKKEISRNGFDHLLWYYHKGRM